MNSLKFMELKTLKNYIKTNLVNYFSKPSKFITNIKKIFIKKL